MSIRPIILGVVGHEYEIFFVCDVHFFLLVWPSSELVVASVFLRPYLEIACDEEIPFTMQQEPVAEMYWRPGIDLQKVVNPQGAS